MLGKTLTDRWCCYSSNKICFELDKKHVVVKREGRGGREGEEEEEEEGRGGREGGRRKVGKGRERV